MLLPLVRIFDISDPQEETPIILADALSEGYAVVLRGFLERDPCEQIVSHLVQVGSTSLPNYVPISEGAADNYRINFNDERSTVPGCFRQFSFYPWNQNILDLWSIFSPIIKLRDTLTDLLEGSKNDVASKYSDWVNRISIQHYPSGGGFLDLHSDPVGPMQSVVPIVILSNERADFNSGGAVVFDQREKTNVLIEGSFEQGDLYLSLPYLTHGVAPIDPDERFDPLTRSGRWIALLARNRTTTSTYKEEARTVEN